MTLDKQYAFVKAEITKGCDLTAERRCIVLCGQPGAGKTTYAARLKKQYIAFDGDRIMELCGGLTEIGNYVSRRLLREFAQMGCNIIYETPLADADNILGLCRKGLKLGYAISLVIIACDGAKALYSTLERSRRALDDGGFVRLCSYGFYLNKTQAFLKSCPIVTAADVFKSVTVLNREGETLYAGADGNAAYEAVIKEVNIAELNSVKTDFDARFKELAQRYRQYKEKKCTIPFTTI